MAGINEIKQEQASVTQIRQITNAMYLLSIAAARKGLSHIAVNDHYMHEVRRAIKGILPSLPDMKHKFLDDPSDKNDKAAFVILGSDKGLCGGYNIDLVNRLSEEVKKHSDYYVVCSGKRIGELLKNRGIHIDEDISVASFYPSIHYARVIEEHLQELYENGEINEVNIIFTDYVNAGTQIVRCTTLFPLDSADFEDIKADTLMPDYTIFEPSPKAAFDVLVPQYAVGYIYGSMCNAYTSEHYARMNAMQSATKNADERRTKLETKFNEARQLQITNELVEIAAAASLYKEGI